MRRLLFVVPPILFAAGFSAMSAFGQTVSVKDLSDNGVTLIAPTTPDFSLMLPSLTSARQRSVLQPILDFSVVLINNTDEAIIAHTLRWLCTAPDGKHTHRTYTAGADVLTFSNGPKVAPHSSILVTPVSSGSYIPRAEIVQNFETKLKLQQEVVVLLDGILFENGRFVGPNESGILQRHQGQFAAAQEIQSTILAKEKEGENADAIFGWLKSVQDLNTTRAYEGVSAIEWYQDWRANLSRMLLSIRRSSGDAAALQTIHKMSVLQVSTVK